MEKLLKSYQKKLTNLTSNNKSLLLLRTGASDMDLHQLNYALQHPSFEIINSLIKEEKTSICEYHNPRDEAVNALSLQLKKIERSNEIIIEERGAKDLYIAWPFVRGKFSDGTLVRCPLLFFPVALTHNEKHWQLELRSDEEISFNKSFLLAYAHFQNTKLSEDLYEYTFDEHSNDALEFRNTLYTLLKSSAVEINFNRDLFVNQLHSFDNFKKSDYEEAQSSGELMLYPEAVLGLFPQAGSYLVPDYEYIISEDTSVSMEDFFIQRTNSEAQLHIKEEKLFTPFAIDAWQEEAIKAAKRGNSLVIQGPPGTGKSQLICNLASDYIARGKNVLIVCQKKAALDVVYQRLQSVGASDFVAQVQDFKSDRKKIFEELSNQIDKVAEYRNSNSTLDAITLERTFTNVCKRIEQLCEDFESLRTALFDTSEFGISVKELYLKSDKSYAELINFKEEYRHFNIQSLESFLGQLKYFFRFYDSFPNKDYLSERVDFSAFKHSDLSSITKTIDEIKPFYLQLNTELELLSNHKSEDKLTFYLNLKLTLERLSLQLSEGSGEYLFQALRYKFTSKWIDKKKKIIRQFTKKNYCEQSLSKHQLSAALNLVDEARHKREHWHQWLWWKLTSGNNARLSELLYFNNLTDSSADLEQLHERIKHRIEFTLFLESLKTDFQLQSMPDTTSMEDYEEFFKKLYESVEIAELLDTTSLKYTLNQTAIHHTIGNITKQILSIIYQWKEAYTTWKHYLTPTLIEQFTYDKDYALAYSSFVNTHFDNLVAFDQLQAQFSEIEHRVINKALCIEYQDATQAIAIVENAIKTHWIEYIEQIHPQLRKVSSLQMAQEEEELQSAILQKTELCKTILLLRLRERTYRGLNYNRLNNLVSYRDLKHQVSKKKKLWSIRKLLEQYSEDIFNLKPCWLASPESVSAVFPMQQSFDIVIFDEASQCYAEKGIPALYRGKQLIIAGDSQQLPPYDLYQVRWEEDLEDEPDLEMESLLDLGNKYLQQFMLEGHYRSETQGLIEFSNHHFYKGKLKSLPNRNLLQEATSAIEFQLVDGLWKDGCNEAEAHAVCRLLERLIKDNQQKSIGVITFNFKQAQLIYNLLERYALENNFIIPEQLFVKNIENVQGDERDIIVFSIAYAANAQGKVGANFGSLNMQGGEKRLNVAITRAKEKIYIVSSIYAQQLRTDDAKNEGPRLLKKYLEYAFQVSTQQAYSEVTNTASTSKDWYLASQLLATQSATPKLTCDIAFADLRLQHHNTSSLLLTDDDKCANAVSVKEFHAYRSIEMRRKAWSSHIIYSRNFWLNKEQLLAHLLT